MMKNFTKSLMILLAFGTAPATNAEPNNERMLDVTTHRTEGKETPKTKQLKQMLKSKTILPQETLETLSDHEKSIKKEDIAKAKKLYTAIKNAFADIKKIDGYQKIQEGYAKPFELSWLNPTCLPASKDLQSTFETIQNTKNKIQQKKSTIDTQNNKNKKLLEAIKKAIQGIDNAITEFTNCYPQK